MSHPDRRRACPRWRALVVFSCLLHLIVLDVEAVRVRELGLADMVARADRVFRGECVERRVHDGGSQRLPYTEYVFRVLRPLKGVERATVTFAVAATPDGRGLVGLPVFDIGDRALLLLYPAVEGGRTSPMGLDQGLFRLVRSRDGSTLAVNGRGNHALFKDVPREVLAANGLDARAGGVLHLDALERVIVSMVRRGGR